MKPPPQILAPPDKILLLAELRERKRALERAALLKGAPPPWRDIARPEQLPPDGDWLVWIYSAGRGAGKTRAAAEWVQERALADPGCRIALVGRTPADVRDVMIEGDSGILAVARGQRAAYQPTKRRLTWPNGSTAYTYSAEVPSQLRGPQHTYAWADEAAAWTDAPKGDVLDTAWNNLMLGLRLGASPRCAVTTTPKPNALIRTILARPTTVVTRGTTYDNLANLAPSFREEVLAAYEGTRIGRQELMGELLEDVEGALWTIALIDANRVTEAPELRRIVVAVDPSGGSGPDSDEQGIVVAGLGIDGHVYVLADRSCKLSPHGWASRAVAAYREFGADRVVAERNFGGDMVASTIAQVDPNVPVKMVSASRGKAQRAEPVAAAYEQGRVHHAGAFPKLEDQMTQWTPADGTSPDRLDACIAAGTLVLTARGEVPIEHVAPGDLAWTRAGWKPVLAARCTRRDAEVLTVGLSSGNTLTGTPDHLVWVDGKGWSRIDALVWGDILSGWQNPPSPWSTAASPTSGTRTPNSALTVSTTTRRVAADVTACTATYGETATPARRSRAAGTSTTPTTTRSTTTPATSFSGHPRTTGRNTRTSSPTRGASGSTPSVPLLPNGTAATKAASGTASMASRPGKDANQSTPRSAPSAAKSSWPGSISPVAPSPTTATAPVSAATRPVSASTGRRFRALSAGATSSATSTARAVPRRAPVSVLGFSAGSERRDVYDLMVAEAHEFVAAGVIVHNCVWAVMELTDNFGAAAWLAWAKRKAEEAALDRGEVPAVPAGDTAPGPAEAPAEPAALTPEQARKAARDAAFRAQYR